MKGKSVRLLAICTVFAMALSSLFGCGGGGGGGGLSNPVLTGAVRSVSNLNTANAAVSGANVKVFVWGSLTTPVLTGVTTSAGLFQFTVPGTAAGKDLVVTADATVNAQAVRYSAIVPDVAAGTTIAVVLDPATTLAAEVIAKKALDTSVTDISATVAATIADALRTGLTGLDQISLVPGGTTIPATFGGGLKAGSAAALFVAASTTITHSLAALSDSSVTDVRTAKQIAQGIRDFVNGVATPGRTENDSLKTALDDQRQAINDSTAGLTAFGERATFLGDVLGFNSSNADSLVGLTSGIYSQTVSLGRRILTRTGNAPDNKSFIVNSSIAGNTLNETVTITPATAMATFKIDTNTPNLGLTVRKTGDATLQYDATLAVTRDGSQNPIQVQINVTMHDTGLTAPITFVGTLTGAAASGSTPSNPAYTQAAFAGTLNSQFGNASIGNATVQWFTSSATADIQKITLTNLVAATTNAQPAKLTLTTATVDFLAANTGTGFPHSTPQHVAFNGTLESPGRKLTLSNIDATFARFSNAGKVTRLTKTLVGTVTYTSPVISFTGTANGAWANPTNSHSSSVTDFPKGSLHLAGNLTPQVGAASAIDVTLTSDNTVTNNQVQALLSIAQISYGTTSLAGSIQAVYPVTGTTVGPTPTVTASLTQTPSGFTILLSGQGASVTGNITNGSVVVARIGPANTLGLNDLGSTSIILYGDNTFETAASLLF